MRPDFFSLAKIDERMLLAKLEASRSAIPHSGEKGRVLEHSVQTLLRQMLPAEYGLSSGFIVWLSPGGPKVSTQLDVIIYDAIRSGPLIDLGDCCVFPLEAVFAYVEVKATLCSRPGNGELPHNSIEGCVARNLELRKMQKRHFWIPTQGSPSLVEAQQRDWLGIRSYIIAFEALGPAKNLSTLATRMEKALNRAGNPAHLHGVFIPNLGLLTTCKFEESAFPEDDRFSVQCIAQHALLAFRSSLLQHLATFQRPPDGWIPALDRYFGAVENWTGAGL